MPRGKVRDAKSGTSFKTMCLHKGKFKVDKNIISDHSRPVKKWLTLD